MGWVSHAEWPHCKIFGILEEIFAFLAVYGLKTLGRKAKLVTRASLAVELKLSVIESSENSKLS